MPSTSLIFIFARGNGSHAPGAPVYRTCEVFVCCVRFFSFITISSRRKCGFLRVLSFVNSPSRGTSPDASRSWSRMFALIKLVARCVIGSPLEPSRSALTSRRSCANCSVLADALRQLRALESRHERANRGCVFFHPVHAAFAPPRALHRTASRLPEVFTRTRGQNKCTGLTPRHRQAPRSFSVLHGWRGRFQ